MDINKFVFNIADQFANTAPSEFKPATRFRELDEYCSLIALYIIGMIFEEYGVSLKSTDLMAADTIRDLYNIVQSYKK